MENHKEFWNYYNVNFDDVFQNEDSAREFIYQYFKYGSKMYPLYTWANSMDKYIQMRNIHTVNVFFIGAFLQRIIDENLTIKSEVTSPYPFSYIWYLSCLAHDWGYVYENYSKIYLELPEKRLYHYHSNNGTHTLEFKSRKCWYQQHGINITYLNPAFGEKAKIFYCNQRVMQWLKGNIEYNNGTIIKGPRYSSKTKNGYFYYRLYEMSALDHGIIGADEFFSRLVVNYVREYREIAVSDSFHGSIYEFCNNHGLHFYSEQLKIFAYIADCIASHNMYKADDNENLKAIYRRYFLECLLPDEYQLISYKDNPLLFILCIADTIEPSKRFTSYRNEEVLKLISIDYNVDTNLLNVEIAEELYNSNAGYKYVADIKGLEKWCDIRANVRPQIKE